MSLSPILIDREQFLAEETSLPSLPALFTRILGEINSGQSGPKEISVLIESDPALVAQILRVVNSAYYALPSRIRSAQHAVAFLGLAEIYRLVLCNYVLKALMPQDVQVLRRTWFHAFYVAMAAKHVARKFERNLDTDDLYSAALLHDIGKLVYIKLYPNHYRTLSKIAEQRGRFLVELESELGFPTHLEMGGLLCERWDLPKSIKAACENHELDFLVDLNEGRVEEDAFLKVVTIANLLVCIATQSLEEELKESVTSEIQKTLDISDESFLLLMADIVDLREEVSVFVRGV